MKRTEQTFALYQKIKASVLNDIESGKLQPDDKIPSETQLAKAFNASRMTANRALKELSEERRILRVQGIGSFVARPKPDGALLEIKSIAKEIQEWGGVHSSQILALEKIKAKMPFKQKMNLPADDFVYHSIIVHMDKGIPIQYSERFINPAVVPDYLLQDFTKITPCDYLLGVAPVQQAEYQINSINCDENIANNLKISLNEPCLRLTRRTWSYDKIATYSIMTSPGSRYHLKGKYIRG